ncbi:MAG TPA: hypothetical protein VLJ37_05280 [bacterium]|nr:hypothetical protein [bacterium]
MKVNEPAPPHSSGPESPASLPIPAQLEGLLQAVNGGHAPDWSLRLEGILAQARSGGFVWGSEHTLLARKIAIRGMRNELDAARSETDARKAAFRLNLLETHASSYGTNLFATDIAELRRKNQYAFADQDFQDGKTHVRESFQLVSDLDGSGGLERAGTAFESFADSGAHLLRGAGMTLGLFE